MTQPLSGSCFDLLPAYPLGSFSPWRSYAPNLGTIVQRSWFDILHSYPKGPYIVIHQTMTQPLSGSCFDLLHAYALGSFSPWRSYAPNLGTIVQRSWFDILHSYPKGPYIAILQTMTQPLSGSCFDLLHAYALGSFSPWRSYAPNLGTIVQRSWFDILHSYPKPYSKQ